MQKTEISLMIVMIVCLILAASILFVFVANWIIDVDGQLQQLECIQEQILFDQYQACFEITCGSD